MRIRFRLPPKQVAFAVLMAAAAVMSLLPASWTSWKRGISQVLGPAQWALSSSSRDFAESSHISGQAVSAEEAERLRAENAELRRALAGEASWREDVERRLEEVTRLRNQLGDADTRILIAPVWGYDSSPRRETLLIGRGGADGVKRGQWVAAGVAASERDPNESGRQSLMRQWLVGRVSEAQTRSSRVVLASDAKFGEPQAGEPVCLARVLDDGRWQPTAAKYVLSGGGRGRMVIGRADADYFRQGYEVVLVPVSTELPVMLSIGRIVGSEQLEESALHFDLQVEPWGDARLLRYVYVIVPGT